MKGNNRTNSAGGRIHALAGGITAGLALSLLFAVSSPAMEPDNSAQTAESEISVQSSGAETESGSGQILPPGTLCGENEYVGLKSGTYSWVAGDGADDVINLYDSQGNLVGSYMGSIDYFDQKRYKIIPKGRILRQYAVNGTAFMSTTVMRTILEVPDSTHLCSAGLNRICTYELQTGRLLLYDELGQVIGEAQAGDERTAYLADQHPIVELYESPSWSAACVGNYGGDWWLVIFLPDGSIMNSESAEFPQNLRGGVTGSLGEFILIEETVNGETTGLSSVVDLSGNIHMSGVKAGSRMDVGGGSTSLTLRNSKAFVMRPMQEPEKGNLVYDEDLTYLGQTEEVYPYNRAGFITGIAYDQLEGRKVEGFVSCEGKDAAYAKAGDMYIVSTGEKTEHVFVPPEEKLTAYNEYWVVTGEGMKSTIYRRSDLEKLASPEGFVSILGSRCLFSEAHSAQSRFFLYDDQFQDLRFTSGWMSFFDNGNLYLKRGPYEGITDPDGNWLLRYTPYTD